MICIQCHKAGSHSHQQCGIMQHFLFNGSGEALAEAGHASKCFVLFQVGLAMNGSTISYVKNKVQLD